MCPILHSCLATLKKLVFYCCKYSARFEKSGIQKNSKYILKFLNLFASKSQSSSNLPELLSISSNIHHKACLSSPFSPMFIRSAAENQLSHAVHSMLQEDHESRGSNFTLTLSFLIILPVSEFYSKYQHWRYSSDQRGWKISLIMIIWSKYKL